MRSVVMCTQQKESTSFCPEIFFQFLFRAILFFRAILQTADAAPTGVGVLHIPPRCEYIYFLIFFFRVRAFIAGRAGRR